MKLRTNQSLKFEEEFCIRKFNLTTL